MWGSWVLWLAAFVMVLPAAALGGAVPSATATAHSGSAALSPGASAAPAVRAPSPVTTGVSTTDVASSVPSSPTARPDPVPTVPGTSSSGTASSSPSPAVPTVPSLPGATPLPSTPAGPSLPAPRAAPSSPDPLVARPSSAWSSSPVYEPGNITSTLYGFNGPLQAAYDSATGELFVTNVNTIGGSSTVSVLSGNPATVHRSFAVIGSPHGIAFDSANGLLYISLTGTSQVDYYTTSGAQLGFVTTGIDPNYLAYDPSNGCIYTANFGSASVSVISGATNSVIATINVGSGPAGIAYDSANGYLYTANDATANVSVINGATNTVIANPSLGSGNPYGIAYDSANGYLYVTNPGIGSGEVQYILGATNALAGSILVPGNPVGIAYDPGNGDLYVASNVGRTVEVLSGTSTSVAESIHVPEAPNGVAYGPANQAIYVLGSGVTYVPVISTMLSVGPAQAYLRGNYVYPLPAHATGGIGVGTEPAVAAYDPDNGELFVPDFGSAQVSVVDGNTGAVVATIPVDDTPYQAVFDSENGYVYVTHPLYGNVSVINPATDQVVDRITGLPNARAIVFDPLNGDLLVSDDVSTTAYVLNGSTNTLLPFMVTVGSGSLGGAFDPDNGDIYFSDSATNQVTVVDGVTLTTLGTIPAGTQPKGVAWNPIDNRIYVANQLTNNVSVLNPVTNTVSGSCPVGIDPFWVAVDPAIGLVEIANSGGTNVSVCYGSSDLGSVSMGTGVSPFGLTYDEANGDMFVMNDMQNNVSLIPSVTPVGVQGTATLDDSSNVLFLEAPVTGIGVGGDQGSVQVLSSSSALSCTALPAGLLTLAAICSPTGVGSATVTLTLQDIAGNVASGSIDVTVYYYAYALNPAVTRTSLDVGQSVTFNATLENPGSGGDSYTWAGLPGGCASADAIVLTCTPNSAVGGPFSVFLWVTDSDGAVSPAVAFPSVTVDADPVSSLVVYSTTSPHADAGQIVYFNASATLGTLSYTGYAWYGLPGAGCTAFALGSEQCLLSAADVGSYAIQTTVTDSNGFTSALSQAQTYTVNPVPVAGQPTASVASTDSGQSVTFSTVASGGSGTYTTYTWSGLPSPCATSTSVPSVTCVITVTSDTTYSVSVQVTDSSSVTSAVSGAFRFTVYADPLAWTPTANVSSADSGQMVTFSAVITGGTGAYSTYTWSFLPTGCAGTSAVVSCAISVATPTTFYPQAQATDTNGYTTALPNPLSFPAYPDPTIAQTVNSTVSADVGQTVTFTAQPSGGSGVYTFYNWSGLPAGCASQNTAVLSCTPTAPAYPATIVVAVTDSNGVTVSTASLTPVDNFYVWTDTALSSPAPYGPYSADNNTTVAFSELGSGGTGSYTYAWSGLPGGTCTGTLTTSVSCLLQLPFGLNAPQVTTVFATVTDSNGVSVTSQGLVFTTDPDPVVSTPVATPASADSGQAVTFATAASLGSGNYYNYTWSGLPATGCGARTGASVTCILSVTATTRYNVSVVVLDWSGVASAPSGTLAFTAYPAPTVGAPSATPSVLDVAQATTLTVAPSGGSGLDTYAWQGLPAGCAGVDGPSLVCVPSSGAGSPYAVTVTVADSNGDRVTSAALALTVDTDPVAGAVSLSATALDRGQSLKLSVAPSGGAIPYAIAWSGLPSGCAGTTATITCIPSATGSFSIGVSVTDKNGFAVSTSPAALTVYPSLNASQVVASPSVLDAGGLLSLSVAASGGSGGLSYAWTGLPGGCPSVNSASITCQPSGAGSFSVGVTVSDLLGAQVTAPAATVSVGAALSLGALSATPVALDVGQSITLHGVASGGSGGLTYNWSGLPSGCASQDNATLTCTPTGSGVAQVSLRVTDATGASVTAEAVEVDVSPALGSPSLSASTSSVTVGDALSFTVSVSGGATPLVFAWSGLPAGCVSANSPSLTCLPTTAGSYSVTVSVTDANGISHTSQAVAVSVQSAPAPSFSTGANGLEWTLLAIALLALVLGVVGLLLALRKRGGGDAPSARPKAPSEAAPSASEEANRTEG